ncbi:MAG: putative glycosyltransferase EpsE [Pelotomaculum sp. PtaB.Bin104]|nr:MAG: putative glycosyltransferase EpsE [Pelotomaculum sp. PtaB.Bin104]
MGKQRLSVAMCTYNCVDYLKEQLDSIALQTRPPDELVICDDRSFDATVEIIKFFKAKAAFPVRFTINEQNLGTTKNFEKAVSLCTGDIIVLSDQDDVWHPEKLMLIEAKMSSLPYAGVVFTDADVVDECLRPMGYRLWEAKRFSPAEQKKVSQGRAFEVLLKHNVVTGATMAFRAKYRELFLPIPASWLHDAWIALIIAAYAELAIIRKPLIKYRQHLNQQLGANKKGFFQQIAMSQQTGPNTYFAQIDRFMAAQRLLTENYSAPCKKEVLSKLEAKMRHLLVRGSISKQKMRHGLIAIIKELATLRYHRYSYGWKSAARDLYAFLFLFHGSPPSER